MNARTARQIDRAQPDLTLEKYLRTLEHLGSSSLISDVSQYTLNNLQKSYAQLDQGTVGADRGHPSEQRPEVHRGLPGDGPAVPSIWPASNSCSSHPPHVVPILHADATAVENLLDITERDCLFLYSFPRYSEIARPLMEIAREAARR